MKKIQLLIVDDSDDTVVMQCDKRFAREVELLNIIERLSPALCQDTVRRMVDVDDEDDAIFLAFDAAIAAHEVAATVMRAIGREDMADAYEAGADWLDLERDEWCDA